MKLRTVISLLIVLLVVSILNPLTSYAQANYVYWVDTTANKIQRANLDGSNVQDIVTGFGRPVCITLDIAGGKMYWTDRDRADHTDPAGRSSIQRANLDGTNTEILIIDDEPVKEYVELDISGGKMYWTGWSNKLRRANLDGSNVEDIVPGLEGRGIALDISRGKIYWANLGASKLQCANLDGSNIQDILTTDSPHGIALDIADGKIYWANWTSGKIQRANLDGSNSEDLVVGIRQPFGIALDSLSGKMYWADNLGGKIQRANLDGTNVEDLVTGLIHPVGIAIGIPQTQGLRFDPNVIADQNFTVGTDVSLTLPTATGGTLPYTYSLTPTLPTGLYFDPIADGPGYIGGTPTAAMPPTPFTYTATDATGTSASLTFTITIIGTPAGQGLLAEVYQPGGSLTQLPDFQALTPVQTFRVLNLNVSLRPCEQGFPGFPGLGINIIENFAIRFRGRLNIATAGTYNFALSSDDGSRLYINGNLIIDHDGLATLARGNPGRGSVTLPVGLHDVEVQFFQGPCSHVGLQWFWQPPNGTEAIVPPDVLYLPDTHTPVPGITFVPNEIVDQTFAINAPIEPLALPVATGGTEPYLYTLDPLPTGLFFDAGMQVLSGVPTTAGSTVATYTATDATGASAILSFTIIVTSNGGLNLDVNGDGQVNVIDLAIVALFYGTQVPVSVSIPADVNTDGVVNLLDLTAVAQGIDAAGGVNGLSLQDVKAALLAGEIKGIAGAPMGFGTHVLSGGIASKNVTDALLAAQSDARLQKHSAVFEELLILLTEINTVPETTALLPNYPNPFNPETWIPYHLANAADVMLTIYDVRGVAVRELLLGYQAAGIYESRGRAAYWDGRNQLGEPVASGVYFYTLTAGDFTATRKLLIAK